MTKEKMPRDIFKRLIQRREENTKALEEKKMGDFKVKRFRPRHETDAGAPSDTPANDSTEDK